MGSSDSLSLPSEPVDIGNWFSSYVYESPELNTIEDLQDSADSIIAETVDSPNESKQNLDGITILARNNDLALDGKGMSDVKSAPRDDTYMSKGLKYSDSFSLGSEPLDVKKWFSSYMYESPVLDTNWEFTSNEKESDAECGSTEQEATLNYSTRSGKDDDSENENTPPDGSVECTNFDEDTENENTYISEGQGNKSLVIAGSSVGKLSNELNPGVSDALLSITNDSQERRWKSKSVHSRLDIKKESSENEDSMKGNDILVCAENTEIINRADAKTVMKTCGGVVIGKENNPQFAETGFISTRKIRSRGVNDYNSLKRPPPLRVKSADLANNGIHTSECSNEEIITGRRKVFSETTNIQPCNGTEVTGKWKCPQKSKPNLGPPLKQLRLEQWLRRV